MVSKSRLAALAKKLGSAPEPLDASGLGELVHRDAWTKTFRRVDEEGTVIGTLVTRSGINLATIGLCMCFAEVDDCAACVAKSGQLGECDRENPRAGGEVPAVREPPQAVPEPPQAVPEPIPTTTAASAYARRIEAHDTSDLPDAVRDRYRVV